MNFTSGFRKQNDPPGISNVLIRQRERIEEGMKGGVWTDKIDWGNREQEKGTGETGREREREQDINSLGSI